jgi:hypothetical protein
MRKRSSLATVAFASLFGFFSEYLPFPTPSNAARIG